MLTWKDTIYTYFHFINDRKILLYEPNISLISSSWPSLIDNFLWLNQIIFQSHWSDHWPLLISLGKPTFPMNFIKFWYFNFVLLRSGWIWVTDLPFKNYLNHRSIMLHLNLPMNLDHRSTSFWKNSKNNPYHRSTSFN
jgi:hypothetical protein